MFVQQCLQRKHILNDVYSVNIVMLIDVACNKLIKLNNKNINKKEVILCTVYNGFYTTVCDCDGICDVMSDLAFTV